MKLNLFCLVVSILFLGVPAQSKQILCQQNLRDVAVTVLWKDKKVTMRVQSPMGFNYLPLIDGPLRPSMLKWAEYQIQQLKNLSDDFTISWPDDKCEWNLSSNSTKTRLECSGLAESTVKGVQFYTLSVSRLVESTLKEEWATRRFRLGTAVDGDSGSDFFFVTIPVPESGCHDYE
jgi:hypothetical protein